jgi:hypothetical protein
MANKANVGGWVMFLLKYKEKFPDNKYNILLVDDLLKALTCGEGHRYGRHSNVYKCGHYCEAPSCNKCGDDRCPLQILELPPPYPAQFHNCFNFLIYILYQEDTSDVWINAVCNYCKKQKKLEATSLE